MIHHFQNLFFFKINNGLYFKIALSSQVKLIVNNSIFLQASIAPQLVQLKFSIFSLNHPKTFCILNHPPKKTIGSKQNEFYLSFGFPKDISQKTLFCHTSLLLYTLHNLRKKLFFLFLLLLTFNHVSLIRDLTVIRSTK